MITLKPFVKWAGGKSQLLDPINHLIEKCPHSNRYSEPFLGGGAVYLSQLEKQSFQFCYLNDVNYPLIRMYQAFRDYPNTTLVDYLSDLEAQYNVIDALDKKEKLYYAHRDTYNSLDTGVYKTALFIFLNKAGFNGLYRENKRGQLNVPFGKRKTVSLCNLDHVKLFSELTSKTKSLFTVGDFSRCGIPITSESVVYLDPPYEKLNEASFVSYSSQRYRLENLVSFIQLICHKKAYFILSNSDTPKVRETFKDFNIIEVGASRNINSDGEGRKKITELLITNIGGTK